MRSMTGYGEYKDRVDDTSIDAVVKTVNNKYFSFVSHIPHPLKPFESEFEDVVQEFVDRGRVILDLEVDIPGSDADHLLDRNRAREFYHALVALKEDLDIEDSISLSEMTDGPGVVPEEETADRDWIREHLPDLREVVRKATKRLNEARKREGQELKSELLRDVDSFRENLEHIQEMIPEVVSSYRSKLEEQLNDLSVDGLTEEDRERINKELRVYIDKVDVTEEIDRLHAHINQFEEAIDAEGAVGRKIDFIAQEMLRETNTIAAKSRDARIGERIVEMKSDIEGIREQTRNIE